MTAPVHLGETFADVMGRATGCPNLRCDNTQPPRAAVPLPDGGWMTSHSCSDCGHAWVEEWVEEWRPVVGFEGLYEVSSEGRVRSVDREVTDSRGQVRHFKAHELAPRPHSNGYSTAQLFRNGSGSSHYIHRLVAAAFIGPCPAEMQVAHNNGNPSDNRLSNLRHATRESNQHDRIAHGTSNRGSRHGSAVLTEADVQKIRERRRHGESFASIAPSFGVCKSTIQSVINGRTWKHLPEIESEND